MLGLIPFIVPFVSSHGDVGSAASGPWPWGVVAIIATLIASAVFLLITIIAAIVDSDHEIVFLNISVIFIGLSAVIAIIAGIFGGFSTGGQ